MFKIVKPAPKIVKLTAGAKKNNRNKNKKSQNEYFYICFRCFFEVFGTKIEKDMSSPGHLVSALLVAGSAN